MGALGRTMLALLDLAHGPGACRCRDAVDGPLIELRVVMNDDWQHLTEAVFVSRWLVVVFGLACLYAGILLYEDEEGRVQNRLEQWWCRLDDKAKSALHVNLRILSGLAEASRGSLDSWLGRKLVSPQSIGILICWGIISAKLTVLILPGASGTLAADLLAGQLVSIVLLLFFVRRLRSPQRSTRVRTLKLVIILWVAVSLAAYFSEATGSALYGPVPEPVVEGQYIMRVGTAIFPLYTWGVILSIPISLSFVALSRWSCNRVARSLSPGRIVGSAALHVLFLVGMILLHVLAVRLLVSASDLRGYLFQLITPVMGAVYATASFYLAFLVHALFWGVMKRPLYALQRLGGERRKKLLIAVGVLSLGVGVPEDKAIEAMAEILKAWD